MEKILVRKNANGQRGYHICDPVTGEAHMQSRTTEYKYFDTKKTAIGYVEKKLKCKAIFD